MRYEQDKLLLERGHKVFVVSCKTFGAPSFENLGGIEIYRIPAVALPIVEYPLPNLLMLYSWVVQIAQREKIDIILATSAAYLTSLPILFLKRVLKKPIILIVQGFPGLSWFYDKLLVDVFARMYMLTFGKKILKVSDKVVLAATNQRKDALRLGVSAAKMEVIPRGVDTGVFHPSPERRKLVRKKLGIDDDDIMVLFAGRLVPVKGITYFLKAAENLAEMSGKWKFLVAGDGVLRGRCETETRLYRSNIRFIGWRRDMPDILNAADVFVLSSISEGFPNTVLEACACGKAVISTRVGAASDIILDGETGLLVEPGDVDGLRDALMRVLTNLHQTSIGEKALQRVTKYFTWDSVISKCENTYSEVLNLYISRRNGGPKRKE